MASPGPSDATAPREFRVQFWLVVGAIKIALLSTSLGVLVFVFTSRSTLGLSLVGLGILASFFGWVRFRRTRASLADSG